MGYRLVNGMRPLEWLKWAILQETNECIEWPFTLDDKRGYGLVRYNKHTYCIVRTHRLALHLHTGLPLSTPLQAAHECDNPPCVNVKHLKWVTCAVNNQERVLMLRRRSRACQTK